MSSSLDGKRIVVTRPADQAESFCAGLEALGAEAIRLPVIRTESLHDPGRLDRALSTLSNYDWVIFTSVNGVRHALHRLEGRFPGTVKVAAIGPATQRALEQHGVRCAFVPEEYIAEHIASGLTAVRGANILLLRAVSARKALGTQLRYRGAHVEDVSAYRTVAVRPSLDRLHAAVDAITFTSSSTAQEFHALVGSHSPHLDTAVIACIGPITAAAARELGYSVDVIARPYTTGGLLSALEHHFAAR